ncbi:gamma-tubulin complex component [Plasmopara halstedii]|uniref:Spindle pole body component n=1 Tax=Plasmopara halstedii TaxID=4781 RepID=A0A0P1A8C8_PLAHL|nr:gamma-tubulin complex component [Plasmopara halstedii]CEG36938.1 gamma-tubulin complex component [Plasmopara halstedii]|eukprot:XP_024573307.1 gamma-tubulin complex component [Plasmopara halstedii]
MHHELFLALLGHVGDVIERRTDGFFIRKDAKFLSQAQRSVLDRLLQLGFAYSVLNQFIRCVSFLPSVYLHALAQAVQRLLDRYTDAIVELEAKTLRSRAVFPLSNLLYELEEFRDLLPQLCALVHRLNFNTQRIHGQEETKCVKGAELLTIVHRNTHSGFPRIRHCMQELLYSCHRVVYQQMMAWMIHGELVDPHDEFFIKKKKQDEWTHDPDASVWHEYFLLDLEAVPIDYFPLAVAQSVFAIGQAVRILTRADHFSPHDVQNLIQLVSELAHQPVFDALMLEQKVEIVRRNVAKRLHDEVVVKLNFIGYLHVLKDFFLLARGEVFQTFIERTFDMMLVRPTSRSEDDVNHGVWHDIVHELIPNDEKWSHDFHMQLPLQTFAFNSFVSTDQLSLFYLSKDSNSKCLSVSITECCQSDDSITPSGSIWWQHAQQDGKAFVSDFVLQWEPDNFSRERHYVALFLRNEGVMCPAILRNGSFELQNAHDVYVSINIAIECLTNGMQVMAQVKPSYGGHNGIQTSLIQNIRRECGSSPKLHVRIQYAREEGTTETSTLLTYTKMIAVIINDDVVLETPLDLPQVLQLNATKEMYYIGLGLSSYVQLRDWNLEKYPAETNWRKGSCVHLKDCNTSVTPRELWHALTLRCHVHWPLQLLVAPEILRSYGHLYQFCFRLKRVAYALEVAWKRCMGRSYQTSGTRAAGLVRSRMSFVVRTLELYFQVFVIQCKFNTCVEQIKTADDFDRVKRVHETFVASVVKSCYVHTKTVASALNELLNSCWDFAEYMLQEDTNTELSFDCIARLDKKFHRRFEFLYSVLQISEARNLLFLLDGNGYFTAERERKNQFRQ